LGVEDLSTLTDKCQQSLTTSDLHISKQPACNTLLDLANEGNAQAYFQLGNLMVHTKHAVDGKKRIKRGLFYLVMAADEKDQNAIAVLSNYVKTKMVNGKIPLRFSHYQTYVEQDWALNGKSDKHHHAAYEQWLNQVEQAHMDPKQLDAETLASIATDYENGYFLGGDLGKAEKLYKLAADKGSALGQFKTGEILYAKTPTQALAYLRKAAKNQSGDAMLKLGDHYGCKGDKAKAMQWYEQAIKQGNEYAADEKTALLQTGKPTQC
jgi:TPR repeat protein